MPSRENFNIFRDIKLRNWKRVKINLKTLFSRKFEWNKKYIIDDTFKTPFNKMIGCKIFGHRWSTDEEFEKYDLYSHLCWKCNKRSTKNDIREDKINNLLK